MRWKEKGIGVAERDSECGGPEGKETTSNIDHIYGSILTLPSQISTLSPPPLLPLSPSPFLSQKPPSSLCVQGREGGQRRVRAGQSLGRYIDKLFWRSLLSPLLCKFTHFIHIHTSFFFFLTLWVFSVSVSDLAQGYGNLTFSIKIC